MSKEHLGQEPQPRAPYDQCVERMEAFLAAKPNLRPVWLPADPASRPGDAGVHEAYARVGSVMVEDVTAPIPDMPIMYDVQIFTEESVVRGCPSARLVKELPALHQREYIDFLVAKRLRRTVVDEEGGMVMREYVTPEETELLAEQLTTLGPLERPLADS